MQGPTRESDLNTLARRYLWWILFLMVLCVHIVWEILDQTPPVWDMAHHQLMGWEFFSAWQKGDLLGRFPEISSYYPPLYYLQEALVLRLFSWTQFLAFFSNLLGFFLLGFCTYRTATYFMAPTAARLAGIVPLLFPLVAWTSRLSLLDVPLAGWVAAAGYLILKSRFMQSRGWTFLLGLALAAGVMTKWTFPLFLSAPLAYALLKSEDRRRSILNLVAALIVVIPPVFWWYLPNLSPLLQRFQMTAQAALWEGDPEGWKPLGWIYYLRCLSSYYLQLPLTIPLAWSLWHILRGPPRVGRARLSYIWLWFLAGLLLLTLLEAKDPRYVMPLVSPLAILLMAPWEGRGAVVVLSIALLQFLVVSFETPLSPTKLALFDIDRDTDYRSMRQEWVFFQTHYFGVAGPPRQEQWRHADILEQLDEVGTVGFVPDSAYFNPMTFKLEAARHGSRPEVVRLGASKESIETVSSMAYVVGKSGSQGLSYITYFNAMVYDRLEELRWPLVQAWALPDQSQALLWRNPTPSQ